MFTITSIINNHNKTENLGDNPVNKNCEFGCLILYNFGHQGSKCASLYPSVVQFAVF